MATLRRALLHLHQTLTLIPPVSLPPLLSHRSLLGSLRRFSSEIDLSDEERKRRLHNRLLYRSRQRGFLELDLIVGKWVEENVRSMDELRMRALADMLDQENPDLWKWLTGQEQPPETISNNPVFTAVQSKVMENLKNHAAPETRANPGQPWVRGWDDKKGPDGPKYGNQ